MFDSEWQSEKIDRHLLAAQVRPFGISFLDDALVGLFPNDLMLIGARTGRGKTELATTLALNASRAGRQVTFFALEADRWEIQRRMKYRVMSQFYFQHYADLKSLVWPRYSEWLVQGYMKDWDALEAQAEADLKIASMGLRIVYSEAKYSVEQFVSQMETLAEETDMIILDHLHYFDLGTSNESEGLKRCIHAIRDMALKHSKPVILLAHLRKGDRANENPVPTLDDFHGHSDIVKVATTILLLAPAPAEEAEGLGIFPTYFHIAKSRRAAENIPYVGILGFDQKTNAYSERYYLAKHSMFKAPELIATEIPKWFKRARGSSKIFKPEKIKGRGLYGGEEKD